MRSPSGFYAMNSLCPPGRGESMDGLLVKPTQPSLAYVTPECGPAFFVPTGVIIYGLKFFVALFATRRKSGRAVVTKTGENEILFPIYRKALVLSVLLGRAEQSTVSHRAKAIQAAVIANSSGGG